MSAFLGSGKIKIALYSSGATFGARNFVDVGNTSAFTLQFSENRQDLRDYQDPAGGLAASVARIESVTGNLDKRDMKASNLARALWAALATLTTTAIVDEPHFANAGAFVPTARIINTAVAPVVKKGVAVVNPADYVVSTSGITFITGAFATSGLLDGDAITISYTPLASTSVEALVTAAPVVSIFFEGINTVDEKTTTVRLYKCRMGAASNLSLIGDDFGTLPTAFTVEKEDAIVGAGLSKFFNMQQAT